MAKIAFLVNSLGKGGAERVVANLAAFFQKQGYEVLLVTSRVMEAEYEVPSGIKRINLSQFEQQDNAGRIGNIYHRINRLHQIWKKQKPDIIVSFIGKLNLYAVLSTLGTKIPLLVSVRSDPGREYPAGMMRMMAKLLFHKTKGMIFQTEDASHFFSKRIQKKSAILPNPLDVRFIRERYAKQRNHEIVSVGTLNNNKNHVMLVKAFAGIAAEYPEMVVKLYGHGYPGSDTTEEIKACAKALGIEDRVKLMGRCAEIQEAIYRARIFVLTSKMEGMPNALMEAMALGLAVVSTDCPCGGPRTLIRDGENGILVPVDDVHALEQALRRILKNPQLEEQLGVQAHRLGEELAPDKVNKMWQDYIESKMVK